MKMTTSLLLLICFVVGALAGRNRSRSPSPRRSPSPSRGSPTASEIAKRIKELEERKQKYINKSGADSSYGQAVCGGNGESDWQEYRENFIRVWRCEPDLTREEYLNTCM